MSKERLEEILNDLPGSIRHSGELEELKEYSIILTERVQELERDYKAVFDLISVRGYQKRLDMMNQNKRYRERFKEILTEEYGSEGLDAERELERVCDIAIEALESDPQ